jgi:hypothetical protein
MSFDDRVLCLAVDARAQHQQPDRGSRHLENKGPNVASMDEAWAQLAGPRFAYA